ncbi:hypothetical protein TCE0_011r00592 [Talaromyces pinophilus]|uniref:Uncharacterized protein n=1 Tax=Talaromyces pinophilus TaxID=128442 RepID=A0A0B8N427_TALPI|nr:hypothetical protein TCE0_011r00592 [Talaromyces pinophilus]
MDGSEKQNQRAKIIQAQIRQGAASVEDKPFAVQVFPRQEAPALAAADSGTVTGGVNASATDPDHSFTNETDDFLTSLYLDTVFPCLFPCYHPATLEGGRSWLLTILKTNHAVFHAAISLSAYYFTLLLARDATHTLRTPCEQHVWDTFNSHMDLSMRLIRQNLSDINAGGRQKRDIFHGTPILDGITHLLIFEAFMTNSEDWNLHLTAALSHLDDIFRLCGLKDGKYHLHSVLLSMQQPSSIFQGTHLGFHVWSADQTSFLFSTAVLLYADIVSSVCLRRVPKLQHCHDALIAASSEPATQTNYLLQMENYFGCYGWALSLIDEIATLNTFEVARIPDNGGVLDEFVVQGKRVEAEFYHGLESLQSVPASPGKADESAKNVQIAKLWLLAGLIYLSTFIYRGHIIDSSVRAHIYTALNLIKTFRSEYDIRPPMWPLCVIGCMVEDNQKPEVRHILSGLPPLQSFGMNKKVANIIETAWEARGSIRESSWSLVDHFESHMSDVLLI